MPDAQGRSDSARARAFLRGRAQAYARRDVSVSALRTSIEIAMAVGVESPDVIATLQEFGVPLTLHDDTTGHAGAASK